MNEQKRRRRYRTFALEQQGGRCLYCREPLTADTVTADHKVSRQKGGRTNKKNIVACCAPCNVAKGHMSVQKYTNKMINIQQNTTIHIRMAHFRYRIWSLVEKAEKNIMEACGL